jgi:hypothetical protein
VDRGKVLKVGTIDLVVPQMSSELLTIFREDMARIRYIPARKYWPEQWPDAQDDGPLVPVTEYRVTADLLSERLELMEFTEELVLAMIDGSFAGNRALIPGIVESEEVALAGSLDSRTWLERLRSSRDDVPGPSLDSRSWLLQQVVGFDFLWRLRAILLAFPEAEVVLDVTEIGEREAAKTLSYKASAYAPIIVLTEGKTDTEFLKAALAILYPHLTDLIRFLDYERRPEGGAGALVNNIRAFAAAGIVNRIIVIFDNDTAAAEALSRVDASSFAPGIQILRYPNLKLAESYPTVGPPTANSPQGSISLTNINGLAGSIEIYLGTDVLKQEDGSLQPIQWTSLSSGMQKYQGEITNKAKIQEKFRIKYKTAQEHPETVQYGDWSGLKLIVDAIRYAARDALPGPSDED